MSYWLISVPCDKEGPNGSLSKLNQMTNTLSTNSIMNIPQLKVGTLDSLMSLSDELVKSDTQLEQIIKKLEKTYYDLVKSEEEESSSAPSSNNTTTNNNSKQNVLMINGNQTPISFLEQFQWDNIRHNKSSSLSVLAENILKESLKIDDVLKKSLGDYQEIKTSLTSLIKKTNGSLLVRPIQGIVNQHKQDFINKGHLTTLLLLVPKAKKEEFQAQYETIEDTIDPSTSSSNNNSSDKKLNRHVVPRSLKLLYEEDKDVYSLYRLVIIKEGEDQIKSLLREQKIVVRPYSLSSTGSASSSAVKPGDDSDDDNGDDENKKLELTKKKKALLSYLIRLIENNYSELYKNSLHLKVIRLYTESLLRYGLPYNNVSFLIKITNKKNVKPLREKLMKLYNTSNNNANFAENTDASSSAASIDNISGVPAEFYPYVYLNMAILEQ